MNKPNEPRPEPKNKGGRPTIYSDEIAHEICDRLADGLPLPRILQDNPSLPAKTTIYRWLDENAVFREMYTRARLLQAESILDDVRDAAIDDSNDTLTLYNKSGNPYTAANLAALQRAKLRIDSGIKLIEKLAPRKYGSKLELAGDKDSPLTVNIVKFGEGE